MNKEIERIISIIKNKSGQSVTRLFHGRGNCFDSLNFLYIDKFNDFVFIVLYEERTEHWCKQLQNQLMLKYSNIKSGIIQQRFEKPSSIVYSWGEIPDKIVIKESGFKFYIYPFLGQNIGYFPDMKIGREFIFENSKNSKVLNMFAYTCSFSIAAISGGADSVVNIDMSKNSLAIGRDNHKLNNLDMRKCSFLSHNILKSFSKLIKLGPFDRIIIDPPSEQGGSFQLERDYPKILRKIPVLLNKNGFFVCAVNSSKHDFLWLEQVVKREIPLAEVYKKLSSPNDFPEKNIDMGLKIIVFHLAANY